MVVPARHAPRPAGAPRPHHRRDIMDQRQALAGAAQPLRDAPGEARAVDGHHRVGAQAADIGHGPVDPAQDAPRARQHLGHAHDRELAYRHAGSSRPCAAICLAADAGEAHRAARCVPSSAAHQLAAERVARRLAGNEIDERALARHRARGRHADHENPGAVGGGDDRRRGRAAASQPASTAMPRRPASRRLPRPCCGPMVGRSARRSCPGFAILTSTPPGPARRRSRAAGEQRVGALDRLDRRAPRPAAPPPPGRCRARPAGAPRSMPSAISASAAASGASRPERPQRRERARRGCVGADDAEALALELRDDGAQQAVVAQRLQADARRRIWRARQSGRTAPRRRPAHRRRPGPVRSTPLARSSRKPLAACAEPDPGMGHLRHQAGSAAPFSASTKNGPALGAAGGDEHARAARRHPATMPSLAAAIGLAAGTGRAIGFGADEGDHLAHRARYRRSVRPPARRARRGCRSRCRTASDRRCAAPGCPRARSRGAAMPTMLRPESRARSPTTKPKGMTSRSTPVTPPTMACRPMRTNWCTARQAAEDGVIADDDVAGQGRVVGHDDVIAEQAVMRDMGADHEQAVVADPGHHAAALGAGVDGHMFADDVVAADDQARCLALVFQVLRLVADGGEGKDARALADARCARRRRHARSARRLSPSSTFGPDHAKGADLAEGGELAPGSTTAVGWMCGMG